MAAEATPCAARGWVVLRVGRCGWAEVTHPYSKRTVGSRQVVEESSNAKSAALESPQLSSIMAKVQETMILSRVMLLAYAALSQMPLREARSGTENVEASACSSRPSSVGSVSANDSPNAASTCARSVAPSS